jgi:diguanylate cyclase (GGDEF)-like protein/PAS domain S-box-containing protein
MQFRSPRAVRLRTVLIAVTAVPVCATSIFSLRWVQERRNDALSAENIESQTATLSDLSAMAFEVEIQRLYFSIPTAGDSTPQLKIDLDAPRHSAWAQFVRAANAVSARDRGENSLLTPAAVNRLPYLSEMYQSAATAPDHGEQVDALARLARETSAMLVEARSNAAPPALAATRTLEKLTELQGLMIDEAGLFIDALGGSLTKDTSLKIRDAGIQQDIVIRDLARTLNAATTARLLRDTASSDMRELRSAVERSAGLTDTGPTLAEALTPETIARAQSRYLAVPNIRSEVSTAIVDGASARARDSRQLFNTAVITMGLTILLSLAISAMTLYRVTRRLNALATRASRIAGGEPDSAPLELSGPREMFELNLAFNRLSEMVSVVDRQISAIGEGRLTDPVLMERLPGRIGQDIDQSVQLLATTTEELTAAEALAASIVDAAADAIFTLDSNGTILGANPAAERITKRPANRLIGARLDDAFTDFAHQIAMPHNATDGLELRRSDGTSITALVTESMAEQADGTVLRLLFVRDISERREFERQLERQATHDELTGLHNRFGMVRHLKAAAAERRKVAYFSLDLRRFKFVNDAYGHDVGDVILKEVARRLRGALPEGTAARMGGDTFALATPFDPAADLLFLAGRIREELSAPFTVNGEHAVIEVSIGIAQTGSTASPEDLPRLAGIALNVAKTEAASAVSLYNDAMSERVEKRSRTEQRLRIALASNELEMFAQPIMNMHSGAISGVELLARWRHEGQWIPPDEFIPIAEETGLISELGRWAMREACGLLEALQNANYDVTVAFNLSGLHLVAGTAAVDLWSTLAARHIDTSRLHVEITESFLLREPELAAARLFDLRTLGAKIFIDDFGTGYSSLTYLHELPIDGLKLDRSFVNRLTESEGSADDAIVRIVGDLADALRLEMVAEGVETTVQEQALLRHGYKLGQGYLWSRPVPIRELWPIVEQNARRLTPVVQHG